jgi:hypothetical protein
MQRGNVIGNNPCTPTQELYPVLKRHSTDLDLEVHLASDTVNKHSHLDTVKTFMKVYIISIKPYLISRRFRAHFIFNRKPTRFA